jgi:transcription initiation factor IIE alpha subunit
LAKELTYDERSKPMQRRALKLRKIRDQNGRCPECGEALPTAGAVLDRLQAMAGYAAENTRLICQPCDTRIQGERRYVIS